jgi:hypothetical protein
MFLFTGTSHFTSMKYDFCGDDPPSLAKRPLGYLPDGGLEIAGAVGLLIPRTRRLAGICLVLMLAALFPANVYAALNEIHFVGRPPHRDDPNADATPLHGDGVVDRGRETSRAGRSAARWEAYSTGTV